MAERIKRGQTLAGLPSKSWNEFVDTAQKVASWPTAPVRSTGQAGKSHGLDVQVLANAEFTADFPIVRLTEVVTTPTENAATVYDAPMFNALAPDSSTLAKFAVMQGPCESNRVGTAIIRGATWCKVVVTDVDHTHAAAVDGDSDALASGTSGAVIQWKEAGTGEKWAVVLIDRISNPGTGDVVLFELTQDKAYADTAKLAKPLDAAGVIDSGADAFYVLDANGRFYGKAVDGIDPGYKGAAILATDDHASTGIPGYRIITMEGPAHFLTGRLTGAWSEGGTPFLPSTTQIWGRPFRGRRLPPGSGEITVFDDNDVASAAEEDDKWLIAWDEAAARYIFICPLQPATGGTLVKGMAIATVAKTTAIDGTAFTASPGFTASAVKKMAWSGTTLAGVGDAMTAVNLTFTDIRASTAEPVLVYGFVEEVDSEDCFLIVWCDLRGLPGYVKANDQVPYHAATEDHFQLDGEDCA